MHRVARVLGSGNVQNLSHAGTILHRPREPTPAPPRRPAWPLEENCP
jgi:hypothetical protein